MSMSDQDKLKLFKDFTREVGWFGQTFTLTMNQLVDAIRAEEELSEHELNARQELVTMLLERISRDLYELRRHYMVALENTDEEEIFPSGLPFEFPNFSE